MFSLEFNQLTQRQHTLTVRLCLLSGYWRIKILHGPTPNTPTTHSWCVYVSAVQTFINHSYLHVQVNKTPCLTTPSLTQDTPCDCAAQSSCSARPSRAAGRHSLGQCKHRPQESTAAAEDKRDACSEWPHVYCHTQRHLYTHTHKVILILNKHWTPLPWQQSLLSRQHMYMHTRNLPHTGAHCQTQHTLLAHCTDCLTTLPPTHTHTLTRTHKTKATLQLFCIDHSNGQGGRGLKLQPSNSSDQHITTSRTENTHTHTHNITHFIKHK